MAKKKNDLQFMKGTKQIFATNNAKCEKKRILLSCSFFRVINSLVKIWFHGSLGSKNFTIFFLWKKFVKWTDLVIRTVFDI